MNGVSWAFIAVLFEKCFVFFKLLIVSVMGVWSAFGVNANVKILLKCLFLRYIFAVFATNI